MMEPGGGQTNRSGGKRIVFALRTGRIRLWDAYRRGESPSDFFYGFISLRECFPETQLMEFGPPARRSWVDRFFRTAERCFSSLLLCRLWLERAWVFLKSVHHRDLVITNIDSMGLSVAALAATLPRRPWLLHVSQGLTNDLDRCDEMHLKDAIRRAATAYVCNALDRVIVLGEGAHASYLAHRLVRREQLSCIQFGVDVSYWRPLDEPARAGTEPYILSVGSDAGRDYATLLQCRFPCKLIVVSRCELPHHAQVEQRHDLSDAELLELYQHAAFVVIPLRDISQPSGQSATLQAMACGKAVIVTRTRGFWDTDGLIDGEHLRTVPPDAPDVLESVILSLFHDPEACRRMGYGARRVVETRYTESHFAHSILRLCESEWKHLSSARV